MAATLLPSVLASLAVLTLIGAIATSDASGSSSSRVRYLRNAPPTMVNTTSLMVAPSTACFTVRMSASEYSRPSMIRWAVTGALKRVFGIAAR